MSLPRYPEYRDSGVTWFDKVPGHWELSVLKRCVLRVESGVSVNAVDEQASAGAIGVLKTSCVYSGRFDPNENKAVVPEDLERVACPVIGGTLIVSRMNTPALVGNAGFVADSAENLFLPDRLWQIHFSGALAKFAYYWTNSPSYRAQVEMACAGTSSSMQNLSQDEFLRFCLPLPSRAEQTAIAAFLDRETAKIDALVVEQQKLVALLKEKRQALISHAVTKGLDPDVPMKDSGVEWLGEVPAHWQVSRLKYSASEIIDCPHETPVYSEDGEYMVIRTADVWAGVIDLRNAYRLSETEYERRTRRATLQPGDIVYGREGERWGYAAQVPDEGVTCLGQRMMQFRARDGISARFLMWQLNADTTYRQGQVDTVGATSPHVNISTISNYVLTEPPIDEQIEIANFLDATLVQLDKLVSEVKMTIALLQERRTALISAAVSGQIDVRGLVPACEEV